MNKQTEGSRFHKARLTIQQCSFPQRSNNHNRQSSSISNKKISYAYLSTNNEKKHINKPNPEMPFCNQKITRYMKSERKSEPCPDELINLPAIRKSIRQQEQKYTMEPIKSYSSVRLTVGPYHKIEGLISSKYSHQLQSLKQKQPKPKRTITISELKGDLVDNVIKNIEKPKKWKSLNKVQPIKLNCKQHLNRVKNQMMIPDQLISSPCEKQTFNNNTFNLQLKNIIRFQFDANLHAPKQPKIQRQESGLGHIDGWRSQQQNHRSSVLFMY